MSHISGLFKLAARQIHLWAPKKSFMGMLLPLVPFAALSLGGCTTAPSATCALGIPGNGAPPSISYTVPSDTGKGDDHYTVTPINDPPVTAYSPAARVYGYQIYSGTSLVPYRASISAQFSDGYKVQVQYNKFGWPMLALTGPIIRTNAAAPVRYAGDFLQGEYKREFLYLANKTINRVKEGSNDAIYPCSFGSAQPNRNIPRPPAGSPPPPPR